MATRQTSSSGRPKSPRIQVVLPEALCDRLAAMAEAEARTVSNMARVLIQQRLHRQARAGGDDRLGHTVLGSAAQQTLHPRPKRQRTSRHHGVVSALFGRLKLFDPLTIGPLPLYFFEISGNTLAAATGAHEPLI
jgi:hypothetical protein